MGEFHKTEYIVTDEQSNVIWGVVDAERYGEAAALAMVGAPGSVMFDEPAAGQPLAYQPAADLADGTWREVAPTRPWPGGEPAGDWQMSDAVGRRFAWRRRDDNLWTVLDAQYCVANDPKSGLYVGEFFEWVVCSDLRDVGGSEVRSDAEDGPRQAYAGPATDMTAVRERASAFDTSQIRACGDDY